MYNVKFINDIHNTPYNNDSYYSGMSFSYTWARYIPEYVAYCHYLYPNSTNYMYLCQQHVTMHVSIELSCACPPIAIQTLILIYIARSVPCTLEQDTEDIRDHLTSGLRLTLNLLVDVNVAGGRKVGSLWPSVSFGLSRTHTPHHTHATSHTRTHKYQYR